MLNTLTSLLVHQNGHNLFVEWYFRVKKVLLKMLHQIQYGINHFIVVELSFLKGRYIRSSLIAR